MENHVYKASSGHRIHLLKELTWGIYDEAEDFLSQEVGELRVKLSQDMADKNLTDEQKKKAMVDALNESAMTVGLSTIKNRSKAILRSIIIKIVTPGDEIIEGEENVIKEIKMLPPQDGSYLLKYADKLFEESTRKINAAKKK